MQAQTALLNDLEHLFRRGNASRRGDIVNKIGELFVGSAEAYTEQQIDLFGDVLVRLVDEIGEAARARLSDMLSRAPVGPQPLLRRLALDEAISVAEPLLINGIAVSDATLIDCATSRGQAHLIAITRRAKLSEAVTEPLVERGDGEVLRNVVSNSGAAFSNRCFGRLIERASGDDTLNLAIGTRPDLPRHHFLTLLRIGSEIVRRELQALDPGRFAEVRSAVTSVTEKIAVGTVENWARYDQALAYVKDLHADHQLGDRQILAFVKEGETERAIAALAILAGLEVTEVEATLRQERFEGTLILVRALGLGWPTAKALLGIQAGVAGLPLASVERALALFERTERATAEKVLALKKRTKDRATPSQRARTH